jgi:hypothetical protein
MTDFSLSPRDRLFGLAVPFDDAAEPDQRIKAIAEQLHGMLAAGELENPSSEMLRTMAMLPMLLLDISGEVYHRLHPNGRLAEVSKFGTTMLAIEPIFSGEMLPAVLHGGSSIYRMTPCSADVAFKKAPTEH